MLSSALRQQHCQDDWWNAESESILHYTQRMQNTTQGNVVN